MFSKRALETALLHVSVLASIAIAATSCAPKAGEAPPPPKEMSFKGTACLTAAVDTLRVYFKGEASNSSVTGAWDCLGGALRSFNKYVRGRSENSFTPQELATFFEDNFFDDSSKARERITPALQSEIMRLKQLFVGGRLDVVTREEINSLVDLFHSLNTITVRLNPYVKVLLTDWKPDDVVADDNQFFSAAGDAFRLSAQELAALVKPGHEPYGLDHLTSLMSEVSGLYGEHWSFVDTMARYMPVVKKVKRALIGGDENVILDRDWKPILEIGSRAYMQFLRYDDFIGPASRENLNQNWESIAKLADEVLAIFGDLLIEKPGHALPRAELDDLLFTLETAWASFKYSPALGDEVMRIKQVLFGGAIDGFVPLDFTLARTKIQPLKILIVRVAPSYKILFGQGIGDGLSRDERLRTFAGANDGLILSAAELGALASAPYDLNSITTLLSEIERLYPSGKSEDRWDTAVGKYLPLVVEFKAVLFDAIERDSMIQLEQWKPLMRSAGRLYGLYLFYDYFLKAQNGRDPGTSDSLSRFADQATHFIGDVIQPRAAPSLRLEEIRRIAIELQRVDVIPRDLEVENLENLLKVAVERILNPPARRLAGETPEGLGEPGLDYIRREVRVWARVQGLIAERVGSQGTQVEPAVFRASIQQTIRDPATSSELKDGLIELNQLLATTVPFTLDGEGRVRIAPNVVRTYDFASLERHNLIREITRLFIASYATERARISGAKGLTAAETDRAYVDLHPVAVDFGLIDAGNKTFMKSRFLEANLFMPSSDGNQMASFSEIHEMLFSIFSGLKIDSLLRTGLKETCPSTRSGKEGARIEYACMSTYYRAELAKQAPTLPALLDFQRTHAEEVFGQYILSSMKAAGYVPNDKNLVKLSDLSLLPPLLQYVELLYARYDLNGDGFIDVPEARRAFPGFKALFKQVARPQLLDGTLKEGDLLGLFMWVLKNGKPPEGVWEGLAFLGWKDHPETWDVKTDRAKVAQILGYIADQVSGTGASKTPPAPNGNAPGAPSASGGGKAPNLLGGGPKLSPLPALPPAGSPTPADQ